MSILIKGMEMPTSCWDCYFQDCGNCVLNSYKVVDKDIMDGCRDEDCPLVELPRLHGRLIDADVALRSEQPSNVTDDQWSQTTLARCIINAPTIIEAESEVMHDEIHTKTAPADR